MTILENLVRVMPLYAAMCLLGFFSIWNDKKAARANQFRISERTLITMGVMCGWPGIFLGMYWFHHKTKKTEFKILMKVGALFNLMFLWIYWALC